LRGHHRADRNTCNMGNNIYIYIYIYLRLLDKLTNRSM